MVSYIGHTQSQYGLKHAHNPQYALEMHGITVLVHIPDDLLSYNASGMLRVTQILVLYVSC